MTSATSQEEIQKLIARTRERARAELPKPSITGLVVSGDDAELQIATRDGIMAVPVSKVMNIGYPVPSRDDIATVFLQDLEGVRTVLAVRSVWQGSDGTNADGRDSRLIIEDAIAHGASSSTTPGAGESMTAGPVAGVNADDSEVHYTTDDCE